MSVEWLFWWNFRSAFIFSLFGGFWCADLCDGSDPPPTVTPVTLCVESLSDFDRQIHKLHHLKVRQHPYLLLPSYLCMSQIHTWQTNKPSLQKAFFVVCPCFLFRKSFMRAPVQVQKGLLFCHVYDFSLLEMPGLVFAALTFGCGWGTHRSTPQMLKHEIDTDCEHHSQNQCSWAVKCLMNSCLKLSCSRNIVEK